MNLGGQSSAHSIHSHYKTSEKEQADNKYTSGHSRGQWENLLLWRGGKRAELGSAQAGGSQALTVEL